MSAPGLAWPSGVFKGFSWHTADPRKVALAVERVETLRKKGGKTAVEWKSYLALADGLYLPWKNPASFAAGYMWFSRNVGDLVSEPGQTCNWRVEGHRNGFDPATGVSNAAAAPSASAATRSASAGAASAAAAAPSGLNSPAPSAPAAVRRRLRSKTPVANTLVGEASRHYASATKASAVDASAINASVLSGSEVGTLSACPVLLFSEGQQELERRHKAYALGPQLGQGSFGTCFSGTRLADGSKVAVKALNEGLSQSRFAFVEAHVLDRCRSHAHIPKLLDVFIHEQKYHLVMEYGGVDLDKFMRSASADEVSTSIARRIIAQVASALRCLHGLGLVHADVKPSNIFVSTATDGEVRSMLGDVGNVLDADPRARAPRAICAQTLWWRAPEVLLGSQDFASAIDIWSLGLVLAELGGWRFQTRLQETTASEVGYAFALFQQLGTPQVPELTSLPLWMPETPNFSRRPWPRSLVLCFGSPGLDALDSMLAWAPRLRPQARTPHDVRTYVRTYIRTYVLRRSVRGVSLLGIDVIIR